MYRFLIVGCGGSGAATLTHVMDQLLAETAPYGFSKLPAGWQFVSVDVPAAAEEIPGLGRISDLGGRYVSTSPGSGSYTVLDNAVGSAIEPSPSGYGEIATWAPRVPEDVLVELENGAGQMRAVGRMVTLNQLARVRRELTDAFRTLSEGSTITEMQRLAAAGIPGLSAFDAKAPPVVLVVSSMAGGAGASMALDVCRVLNLVPGIEPGRIGVFAVTPDAFDSLPAHLRGGVRANALGMFGEIVSAQMTSAEQHDRELLSALGENVPVSGRAPFMRLFPVGGRVGATGARFGDGTQAALYRGLGRGISALMLSERATHEFVNYDLTNSSPVQIDRSALGWGGGHVHPDPLPWGTFGFASLSMGRDRYRHYAAQRIARTAVDHLLEGHLQPESTATREAQLAERIESQWERSATDAGFPGLPPAQALSPERTSTWFTSSVLTQDAAHEMSTRVAQETVATVIPQPAGRVADWQSALAGQLRNGAQRTLAATDEAVYRWAFDWAATLQARVLAETTNAISMFGLPYAREFVRRIGALVSEQLVPQLAELARGGSGDPSRVAADLEQELASMAGRNGNAAISNGQALFDRALQSSRDQIYGVVYARAAARASELLARFTDGFIAPLAAEISEQNRVLITAQDAIASQRGLANVHTTDYALWPSDRDKQVPERFGVANNEVLITPAETFASQYERDLPRAVQHEGQSPDSERARRFTARRVITGEWPVSDGEEAPGGLLDSRRWLASGYSFDPSNSTDEGPRQAVFSLALSPAQILDRARAFVDRRGASFDAFCSLSLVEYASGPNVPASERKERAQDLVRKFGQALGRALPLTQVDPTLVQEVHGRGVEYMFKFSDVPFGSDPEIREALGRELSEMSSSVSSETQDVFTRALKQDDTVTRIDIFGSYRNYSPLVFTGVLAPPAEQWAQTPPAGRRAFWEHRRTRPLPASLPMTDAERQTMIAGWYVANLTGRLRLPDAPYTDAVAIWDDQEGSWAEFPNPLLTAPDRFIGRQYDWLPAVLESSLLAYANVGKPPVLHSLRPYDALARVFDRGSEASGYQGPSEGMLLDHRLGQILLADWLETGAVPSHRASAVGGATKQERLDNAGAWLEAIHNFATNEFLPVRPESGASPGAMSRIGSRRQANNTPIFRDLAADIQKVTAMLKEVLAAAAVQDRVSGASGVTDPETPTLSIGAF